MGLPSFVFTKWQMLYKEREHANHVLKSTFCFNYFTRHSGIKTKGSQEFIPKLDGGMTVPPKADADNGIIPGVWSVVLCIKKLMEAGCS